MDIYVCGVVCLCVKYIAYCSSPIFTNLPPDIKYVHINNNTYSRDSIMNNDENEIIGTDSTMIKTFTEDHMNGKIISQITEIDTEINTQTSGYINTKSMSISNDYHGYTSEITINPPTIMSDKNVINKWIVLLSLLCVLMLLILLCCMVYMIKKRICIHTTPDIQIEMNEITNSEDDEIHWSAESIDEVHL